MRLARTLRFDISDSQIFELPAEPDEWAVSGTFEFSNWSEDDLKGKKRQAFVNGWLGLESFGRSTFVAVAEITEQEFEAAVTVLAQHFVDDYGAPGLEAARSVAAEELAFMQSMCADHAPNTLLVVERKLVDSGVSEAFRSIQPQEAAIDLVAIHGTLDE
ncbi:MAG: DUF6505 family protein [Pseudomonadota bacterium]